MEEGEVPDGGVWGSGQVRDELPRGIPLPAPYTVESLQKHRLRVESRPLRHRSTGGRLHPLPSRLEPARSASARWASERSGGGGEEREREKSAEWGRLGIGTSGGGSL